MKNEGVSSEGSQYTVVQYYISCVLIVMLILCITHISIIINGYTVKLNTVMKLFLVQMLTAWGNIVCMTADCDFCVGPVFPFFK